jgi:hypothetical protein
MPPGIEDMLIRLIDGCARAQGRDVGQSRYALNVSEEIHERRRLGRRARPEAGSIPTGPHARRPIFFGAGKLPTDRHRHASPGDPRLTFFAAKKDVDDEAYIREHTRGRSCSCASLFLEPCALSRWRCNVG